MFKRSRHLFPLLVLFILSAAPAFASYTTAELLAKIETLSNVGTFLYPGSAIVSKPVCNTQNRYVINTSNATGQVLAQQISRAVATKSKVTIIGTGSCTTWGDSEEVSSVTVFPPTPTTGGQQFVSCVNYMPTTTSCNCAAGTTTLSRVTNIDRSNGCYVVTTGGAGCFASGGDPTPGIGSPPNPPVFGSCCLCAY